MIRNLKALGLTLAVALVVSAMSAMAAQAESPAEVVLGEGTTSIDMSTAPGNPGVFNRLGRTVSCEVAEIQAHPADGATTITTTEPNFEQCTSPSLKKPATVFMNDCHFTFHLTADASDNFSAISDLNCETGKEATIAIYNNAGHTEVLCLFHFASQSGKTNINLTNKAASVEADIGVGKIKSTRTTGSILNCGAANDETATLTATANVIGTDAGENETSVQVATDK